MKAITILETTTIMLLIIATSVDLRWQCANYDLPKYFGVSYETSRAEVIDFHAGKNLLAVGGYIEYDIALAMYGGEPFDF